MLNQLDEWEKLGWVICVAAVILAIVTTSVLIFTPHTFEGYYLSNNKIWASYAWAPDESVCSYNAEMWKCLVDNNLIMSKGETK